MTEAQCPECGAWCEVTRELWWVPDGEGGLTLAWGPLWWRVAAACPCCDAVSMVESECDFRDVPGPSSTKDYGAWIGQPYKEQRGAAS